MNQALNVGKLHRSRHTLFGWQCSLRRAAPTLRRFCALSVSLSTREKCRHPSVNQVLNISDVFLYLLEQTRCPAASISPPDSVDGLSVFPEVSCDLTHQPPNHLLLLLPMSPSSSPLPPPPVSRPFKFKKGNPEEPRAASVWGPMPS